MELLRKGDSSFNQRAKRSQSPRCVFFGFEGGRNLAIGPIHSPAPLRADTREGAIYVDDASTAPVRYPLIYMVSW